ncbi:hypothetical protein HK096_007606, partial [Nowakowskiella sp. JEL0078]
MIKIKNSSFLTNLRRMFVPEPLGGWFYSLLTAGKGEKQDVAAYYSTYQLRPWWLVSHGDGVSDAALGVRGKDALLDLSALINPKVFPTLPFITISTNNNTIPSILDTLETRYYLQTSYNNQNSNTQVDGLQKVPFFNQTNSTNPNDFNNAIGQAIQSVISVIKGIDKTAILKRLNRTDPIYQKFIVDAAKAISQMPYGGVYFNKFDTTIRSLQVLLEIGTDSRLENAANFPTQGLRQHIQVASLDNAMLRLTNTTSFGNASITQGVRLMPYLLNTQISFSFSSMIAQAIFPFGVSFLLPIFVITLVKEKE